MRKLKNEGADLDVETLHLLSVFDPDQNIEMDGMEAVSEESYGVSSTPDVKQRIVHPGIQPGEGEKTIPTHLQGTFDNADHARFYKPVSTYEGLHRWDPEFEWDEKEEKRLIRSVYPHRLPYASRD